MLSIFKCKTQNMRTIEMKMNVSTPHAIQKLVDPRVLRAFHGEETAIGEWRNGERELIIPVNTSGSPIALGSRLKARVLQRYDGSVVRNSMHLCGLNILQIESSWHIENATTMVSRARIIVSVPPPLNWIAERFVERRARSQIHHFLELASEMK